MPPLKSMLKPSLDGFGPAPMDNETQAPAVLPQQRGLGPNPYRRCPLPPLSSSPDSLRQFDESGQVPARRILPLPAQVAGTGNTTIVNNTSVTNQGGGSSGGGSTVKLTSATVSLSVGMLSPGQAVKTSVQMSKSFQLLLITSNQPIEVRLYSNSFAQNGDVVRVTNDPPPFEVSGGIITDVVFDTSPYQWSWQNRVGANADPKQSATIYVTIVNPNGANVTSVSVVITYLPLES